MEASTKTRARSAAKKAVDDAKQRAKAFEPSRRVMIASVVAESITLGAGIAATITVTNALVAALSLSVGTFLALAIAMSIAFIALTAVFAAGGWVGQAVREGLIAKWYERSKDLVRETRHSIAVYVAAR